MSAEVLPLVVGSQGIRGRLAAALPETPLPDTPVSVRLEDGRQIQFPFRLLQPQPDGSYRLPLSLADLDKAHVLRKDDAAVVTFPVLAEEAHFHWQNVVTGRVRVQKTVREHQEIIPVN